MMGLIKSELYKTRKEKYIPIIILGIVGVVFFSIFGFSNKVTVIGIKNVLGTNAINLSSGSSMMIEILKSGDVLILFFLPVVTSILMMDFSVGTIKNNIISGYSRSKIYISKLMVSSMICILFVLLYSLSAFLFSIFKNGYDGNLTLSLILNTIKVIAIQSPMYIAAISTAFMLGVITQRKLIVVTIYLLYQVAILMLCSICGRIGLNIATYEPISNLDKVANIGVNTFSYNLIFVLSSICIILITTTIGIIINNKMDIK